ncbi:MFS transporter [Luteolibacter flavescens]|uniref:MFS transporter n=1 Tax=Luteolibacter flavescens TaxID=1859460 RepID=A0ABT3FTJ5_9BACT|nr:MFS transporter [Luteolibacter flavescens]MCW1886899.1 MFS transporter [Luteolibacter flavescens]
MNETTAKDEPAVIPATSQPTDTVLALIFAISASHLLNDTIQALLPSIYPILKESYQLSFAQLGLITFTFQLTASLLQPLVGLVTDRKPMPYALPVGMTFTLIGLVCLAHSTTFPTILMSAAMIGTGSAVFHPEASRIAFMAAGKRRGLAQSIFQVGGNAGSAIGPLLAALVIVPHGQRSILAFSAIALLGVVILTFIGRWQSRNFHRIKRKAKSGTAQSAFPRKTVVLALTVLVALTFSKYVYLSSLTSYYTFYLIDRFHISVQSSQYYLFLLLAAVAVGTIAGGPIGDRIGRKRVIWASILGVAPFSLMLPHVGLGMTAALSVVIGLVLASAFSAILVYAQELLPGKVGMIAGLFFGLAFGIAGIGSAVLGKVADHQGINFVFQICAYLPLIGILTVFLPDVEADKE